MARTERYFIGPGLLADIRRTIDRVDVIPHSTSGASSDTVHQELQRGAPGRLRRGTFTGSWDIGSTAVVTIIGSTQTVSVTNYCINIAGDTSSTAAYNVIFGSAGGTVSAVEIQQPTATCTMVIGGVNLKEIPGYDATTIQLLGHPAEDDETVECHGLRWYSVTQCGTTAT